jgi:hypothetical protein
LGSIPYFIIDTANHALFVSAHCYCCCSSRIWCYQGYLTGSRRECIWLVVSWMRHLQLGHRRQVARTQLFAFWSAGTMKESGTNNDYYIRFRSNFGNGSIPLAHLLGRFIPEIFPCFLLSNGNRRFWPDQVVPFPPFAPQ